MSTSVTVENSKHFIKEAIIVFNALQTTAAQQPTITNPVRVRTNAFCNPQEHYRSPHVAHNNMMNVNRVNLQEPLPSEGFHLSKL